MAAKGNLVSISAVRLREDGNYLPPAPASAPASTSYLTWEKRPDDLAAVLRYAPMKVMYLRSNDALHVERVEALVQDPVILDLASELYPDLDRVLVQVQARHHDDPEIFPKLGDVTLQAKLVMNADQLSDHQKKEIVAAREVAAAYATKRGPRKVQGYPLLDLYFHAIFKDCMEAQLVSVVDKMDGFCEALHELLAGNVPFAEPVINYLTKTFPLNRLVHKYPLIRKIFLDPRNPFVVADPEDPEDGQSVAQLGALYRGKPATRNRTSCRQSRAIPTFLCTNYGSG
jgi:hypothetical protein